MSRNRGKAKRGSPGICDPVTKYALSVKAAQQIAGPLVRAACERHLQDLDAPSDFGYHFDIKRAQRAIEFFADVLKLNGGEFEDRPFVLQPWQKFIVGSLFGWVDSLGVRRFQVAYLEIGKGSGKSPLAAGIGLFMLVADSEPRAEVYAAATKKDQAMILFRDAVAMVDLSPELSDLLARTGGQQHTWNLAHLESGSFFRAISSDDGQSGPRPHCALIDEIHEHKNDDVVEMMRAGFKGRRQPLLLMITNSGRDQTSVCWTQHQYGERVVTEQIADERYFAFICSVDAEDEPFEDESCWIKANPNLGVSIQPQYLRDQVREAKGMPSKESRVRRLNFCQWVESDDPFISRVVWEQNGSAPDMEVFATHPVYVGLDLSARTDLTACVFAAADDSGIVHVFPTCWMPEQGVHERVRRDRAPYDVWIRQGKLLTTPGATVDYDFVADAIMQRAQDWDIVRIAFDRWRVDIFKAALRRLGVSDQFIAERLVEFGQGFKDMAPALDETESLLLNCRVRHGRHPVLTMCASNATISLDPAGGRKLNKAKSSGRIDAMVATAMALGVMPITSKPQPRYQMLFI
ncbi:MAG: terminase TerL endonuclease subunit [Burkholderiaceae bacterium]